MNKACPITFSATIHRGCGLVVGTGCGRHENRRMVFIFVKLVSYYEWS